MNIFELMYGRFPLYNTPDGEGGGGADVLDKPVTDAPADGDAPARDASPDGSGDAPATPTGDASAEDGGDDAPAGDAPKGEGDEPAAKGWRDAILEEMAGDFAKKDGGLDRDKIAKRLERWGSQAGLLKSLLAAEQKISSGEYKKAVDLANASEEEAAEWRKENGVPETAEAYTIPENLEHVGDLSGDDPSLQNLFGKLHATGASQAVADEVLSSYNEAIAYAKEEVLNADKAFALNQEDELRSSWGEGYRPRMKLIEQMMSDVDGPLPAELGEELQAAKRADGRPLFKDARFQQWLSSIATDHYGEGSLVTGEAAKAVTDRKAEIEKIMKTDFRKYKDEGMDSEYRKILEQEERQGKLRR